MRIHRGFVTLAAALLAAISCESPTDPIMDFTVRVSGVVRDAVTGQPISGAEVTWGDVDVNCTVDQDDRIDCEWNVNQKRDFTNGRGTYVLTLQEHRSCWDCEHHSGQCMLESFDVKHSGYDSSRASFEILCQSGEQTVPDIELEPLGG